jgi:spermidine synthase
LLNAGDARLNLRDGPAARFDVLVLDAFTSDAIPMHLVTREALDVYRRALTPNGILLAHVSNRHVELAPIFGALGRDAGMVAASRRDTSLAPGEGAAGKTTSEWLVLSAAPASLAPITAKNPGWRSLTAKPTQRAWTDDFADVLSSLRL